MDSLDNYKILSERMNVLTIYLPWGKIGIASDLRIVKTAVSYHNVYTSCTMHNTSHCVISVELYTEGVIYIYYIIYMYT